jgi:hypothetical protein
MKFEISRTSLWSWDTDPPCEGAAPTTTTHPTTGQTFCRWHINIDTLEALIEFIRTIDEELIIGSDDDGPTIEIYDTYRE